MDSIQVVEQAAPISSPPLLIAIGEQIEQRFSQIQTHVRINMALKPAPATKNTTLRSGWQTEAWRGVSETSSARRARRIVSATSAARGQQGDSEARGQQGDGEEPGGRRPVAVSEEEEK